MAGDSSGENWATVEVPTAPTGTNQAIYVMRYWLDTYATDAFFATAVAWSNAQYWGFKFDSTHMDVAATTSDFADFFGCMHNGSVAGTAHIRALDSDADKDEYASIGHTSGPSHLMTDGNGSYNQISGGSIATSAKDANKMMYTLPVNPTIGALATYVWRVRTHASNQSVNYKGWVNTDGIDLKAFDLLADVDPDSPETALPVSNSWTTAEIEINGSAETGTNWRPSTGVMGFPTHFLARYAMPSQALVIDSIQVRYDILTLS